MPCGSRISRSIAACVGVAHAERVEIEPRRVLVEQAQHDALARARRQRRHADVDLLVAELQRDAPVLRQPLLGDVEARHDLEARDERRVQRARRLDHVVQHAVDAEAHDRAPFVGLEVEIGRALAQRLQQQRVDHPDHRRLRAAVEQVLRRRQVLHQPREIGLAREVLRQLRDAADRHVVGARELGGEALGVDGARRERTLQHALQLREPFDRRVGPRQDDDGVAFVAQREHALRLRERVADPLRVGPGRRGGHAIGHRRSGGEALPPSGLGGRRARRRRAPESAALGRTGAGGGGAGGTAAGVPGITPSGGSCGCVVIAPEEPLRRRRALLLAHQVVVALGRDRAGRRTPCARRSASGTRAGWS